MFRIGRYSVRGILIELSVIGGVAILLAGVHVFVPAGLREQLVFTYADPDIFTALTAAYLHASDSHLYGNLAGYLLGAVLTYTICLLLDQRRWYWLTFLSLLTLLPMLVNGASVAIVRTLEPSTTLVGRGFSGVVAGFGGFLLVTVPVILREAYDIDRWTAINTFWLLVVVLLGEIAWSLTDAISPPVVGTWSLGLAILLLEFARRGVRLPERAEWPRIAGAVVVASGMLGVLSVYVLALFPAEITAGGSITNILGHYAGMVFGAVIAGWGFRYWRKNAVT